MPVIKSAKKKLRQDKKRTLENAKFEQTVKDAIKDAVKAKSAKAVSFAQGLIGKAQKKNVFHKNKASRLVARLAKLISKSAEKTETAVKTSKKAVKKAVSKKTK